MVFGADRRVSALIYSGRGRSAKGVGVGSSLRAVRAAYPGASCVDYPGQTNCTLKSTYRSRAVNTVFHFIKTNGRLKCDRVLVYLVDAAARGDGRMSSEVRRRLTARRAPLVALAGGALAIGSAGAVPSASRRTAINAGTNAQQAADALNQGCADME